MSHVPDRIDLPLRVATAIVLQGLRIRLGRSLVTVSGVLLGIAFLTSTATTHLVKEGVRDEDQIRGEVGRMLNFFGSELGTLQGKSLALISVADPTPAEQRLAAAVAQQAARIVNWEEEQSQRALEADAVLLIGSLEEGAAQLQTLSGIGFTAPIGVTRLTQLATPEDATLYLVPLSAELTASEREMAGREKIAARSRTIWILVIALLVTVMGITNSMLMSVSERFQEIGTMKCLGATARLVRRIFLIESLLIGISGALSGAVAGVVVSIVFYCVIYGPSLVASSLSLPALVLWLTVSVFAGVALTVLSAIYPANLASSMMPAAALRSNV